MFLARVPVKLIEKYQRYITDNNVDIELVIDIDDMDKIKRVRQLKQYIKTVHLPFFDISLGSKNKHVRNISYEILVKSLDMVKCLDVHNVVIHHNYMPYYYAFMEDKFVEIFCDMLLKILNKTDPAFYISVENVFEDSPEIVYKIIKLINDKRIGACFDFGHFNLFSRVSLDYWLKKIYRYIIEYHIHNNFGIRDDHNGIDKGSFNFKRAFKNYVPKFLVFENNNIDDFERSVKIVKRILEENHE